MSRSVHEAAGPSSTDVRNPGCAEYARAIEHGCELKPPNLTLEEAAALPTSASAACTDYATLEGFSQTRRC